MLATPTALLLALLGQLVPGGPPAGPSQSLTPAVRAATRVLVRQAGQRLDLPLPPGAAITGTISAPGLTGGVARALSSMPELEVDTVNGLLSMRIPPREPGPISIRWTAPGGVPGVAAGAFPGAPAAPPPDGRAGAVTVRVLPPNLHDGIRVDGVVDAFESELLAGNAVTVSTSVAMIDLLTFQPAGSVALEYATAVDTRSVYLRLTWEDATEDRSFDLNVDLAPQRTDGLIVQLDANSDGLYDIGDDTRTVFPYLAGSGYLDGHTTGPGGPDTSDVTTHGVARMDYDTLAGTWTAEFVLPRAPDTIGQDADFTGGIGLPFNVLLQDGIGTAAVAPGFGSLFGFTGPDASGWGTLPEPPPLVADYAPVATPTQGTFICVSTHEHPFGELYELDLPTGTLTRLTFNNRTEDWVSVAPDGSWAAYGSSPDPSDLFGYEIYTWERATGLETALTNDTILDGHPAISPDGTRLAFATFDAGFESDIHLMDRDGSNRIALTVTPLVSENDPEWTKDGLLHIKSTQWTGLDLLGLMDLSGNVFSQLTAHAFSDHDGFITADDTWVLYERFERTGPWGADFNLLNSTPWSIRMVSVDGLRHRLLANDGLVNWLPVEGPQGTLVYFATVSFDGLELRMTDRFGTDRGRLAPTHGHIRYMDWK